MAEPGRRAIDDRRALAFMALSIVTGKAKTIRGAARMAASLAEGKTVTSTVDRLRTKYSKDREQLEKDARERIDQRSKPVALGASLRFPEPSSSKPTTEQKRRFERAARSALKAMKGALGIEDVSPEEEALRRQEMLRRTASDLLESLRGLLPPEDE